MLSELDMMNLWAKQLTGHKSQWGRLFGFGYAVESEVRKQDDELIRQMLGALEESSPYVNVAHEWKSSEWIAKRAHAITAARARLGENR